MTRMIRWMTTSRRRDVFVTLAALLILDLGRSAYARVGYAPPAEPWQPGSNLPEETPLGERVYIERCASCHDSDGHGDGPAAPSTFPRPRDLTAG